MKLATLLPLFFVSSIAINSTAMANIGIGSSVKFTVTLQEGPFQQKHTEESIVTSFEESTDMFTVTQTTLWENYKPSIKTYQVSKNDTVKLATQYKDCENLNGTWEQLDLPVGTIKACAVPFNFGEEYGTVWFADIGFGVAKVFTQFKGLKATRTRVLTTISN